MERNKDIDNLFIELLKITDEAIKLEKPDNFLINSYFTFRENLKENLGSGANVTAISEFLYFSYVKKYLEQNLLIKFKRIDTKEENKQDFIYYFKANYNQSEVILTSGIRVENNLGLKLHPNINIEPDIFICIRKGGKITPVAIFEIKIWQEPSNIKEFIIERFKSIQRHMSKNNIPLPFFVFLLLGYRVKRKSMIDDLIREFLQISDKCRSIGNRITKWTEKDYNNKIEGNIREIMSEIVASLKN